MNCRVGDFGLSVDLSNSSSEEGGIYSGDEGAKIPVRWASIEVSGSEEGELWAVWEDDFVVYASTHVVYACVFFF